MKPILVLAALSLAILPARSESADDHYKQGLAAMSSGDVTAARNSFNHALRLKPNHAYARFQLGKLKTASGDLVAKRRANELASVKLASVQFDNVAFSDALAALNHMVEEKSGAADKEKAFSPNFMIQDPKGQLGEKEVTLNLKGVPAKTAFDYLLQQAGATARYDEHATIVRPAASTQTAAAPAAE